MYTRGQLEKILDGNFNKFVEIFDERGFELSHIQCKRCLKSYNNSSGRKTVLCSWCEIKNICMNCTVNVNYSQSSNTKY